MRRSLLAGALGIGLALSLSACSPEPSTQVIIEPPDDQETTATLTPLERGALRRHALEDVQTAVDAWTSGDTAGVTEGFEPPARDMLLDKWRKLAGDGRKVVHRHKDAKLSMIDLKKDGSQALVNYDFKDDSYVVDRDGGRSDPVGGKLTEIQLTIEPRAGEWKIIRMIGGEKAIR